MKVPPAVKAGRDLITQGLIWGMYTSPAVIKPETVRPFAPKDSLALPGDSFCLQNQACNFPSPLLSPSVSVSGQSCGSAAAASLPGDNQDSWPSAEWCETSFHCRTGARKPPKWLFSCRSGGVWEIKPGETLRHLCAWKKVKSFCQKEYRLSINSISLKTGCNKHSKKSVPSRGLSVIKNVTMVSFKFL